MKNVKRGEIPCSLLKNSKKWTEDLLNAITEFKDNGKKIPDSLKNRYKQDDVLVNLKKMYDDGYDTYHCCYCESPIEPVSWPHIDHRKPKDINLFPEDSFNWDNLHLSCETCNVKKGNKWNEEFEILDTVIDVPIEEHLGYRVEIPEGVYRETITDRGITTVEHTDLNRKSLRMARLKIWHSIIERIKEINSWGDNAKTYTAKQILKHKCTGSHGSLIAWVLIDWNIS